MEQQRVAIVRIVMDILRRLAHEEGRCVIVVTHDPEVAEAADLVLRLGIVGLPSGKQFLE